MKVLVVGGSGFIGSVVARQLSRAGFSPVVFDNLATGYRQTARGFHLIQGDICREEDLVRAFANHRIGGVIHLAGVPSHEAEDPMILEDTHARYPLYIGGVMNLARVMRDYGVSSLVLASDLDVYRVPCVSQGARSAGQRVSDPAVCTGRIALAMENFLLDSMAVSSLKPVVLRFGWVSGADLAHNLGDDRSPPFHWLSRLIRTVGYREPESACLAGEAADEVEETSPGGCSGETRAGEGSHKAGGDEPAADVLHVSDVARAFVLALQAALDGRSGIYALGTGRAHSLSAIQDLFRHLAARRSASVPFARGEAAVPPATQPSDLEKVGEDLGWKPTRSDLATALRDAIQWRARFPQGYRSVNAWMAQREATQTELFGEIAVRLGFVSPQDVIRALEIQKERAEKGLEHKLIGMILLEEGMLNSFQLIEILRRFEVSQEQEEEEGQIEWRLQT